MVLANLRARITADDFGLVLDLLARNRPDRRRALERKAERAGLDPLLDDPELFDHLRRAPASRAPSAPLFFYVAVRRVLLAGGIDDSDLADYLGALLYDFGHRGRAYRIAPHDDQTYHTLTDIVADMVVSRGRREFLLRAHLGNYSLWLAGVFPDHIAARRERKGGPDISYYERMGVRGYRAASDHHLAHQLDLSRTLSRVAESFSAIRVALNRLSDRLLSPGYSSADRLMRQVADGFRHPERA